MPFLNLPSILDEALTARGYAEPTPVQSAVLEPEAVGRDLLVSAQTGSGKTVAFGIAMAGELLGEGERVAFAVSPQALIIAPTRELALQVSRELVWLYGKAGARIATCVGGMDASKERRSLRDGAHIVVGTPGRLRDHLERGALVLENLKTIVLDEADEMLDMGFREDLEEILDATPEDRRTLLFSATMPSQIANLAKRYQKDALRISTITGERGHGDITYQAMLVSPSDVENAVVNLLRFHEAETAMLFCATRENVRRLHATLQERGFGVVALSGEHSQSERNHALQALRDRRARVCVATDVAARGIDLPTLSLVVHVEIPRDAETLQHRSGRTGRAGKKGTAVFVVPFNRRRRVETLLRSARIETQWVDAPTPEAIRVQDRARLLETLRQQVDFAEEDRELGAQLLTERSAEDIAAALVHFHRSAMPMPEELVANSSSARSADREERHREGFEDTVWFKMDIGRRQNADPRWILPILCRRGHITRNEIGAIRISQNETFFQVPRAISEKFTASLARTMESSAEDGGGILIEESAETPRDTARQNRRSGPGGPGGGGFGRGERRGNDREGGRGRDFGDRPRGDRPQGDRPFGDRPRGDRPQGDRPFGDRGPRAGFDGPRGPRGPGGPGGAGKPWAKKPHRGSKPRD